MNPVVPRETLRLFPGYEEADLTGEEARTLLLARLLEDGDAADLAWLAGRVGEAELAAFLERCGARLLSVRSRAFWEVVLGRHAGPPGTAGARDLWPL